MVQIESDEFPHVSVHGGPFSLEPSYLEGAVLGSVGSIAEISWLCLRSDLSTQSPAKIQKMDPP